MKIRSGGLLSAFLLLCVAATAQDRSSIQECRNDVADALGIGQGAVNADFGPNGDNGNRVVAWEANLSGRRIVGFCETNRNGRTISTQLGRVRGGGEGPFGNGPGQGNGPGGGPFGNGRGGNNSGAAVAVQVDTDGRGTFNGTGQNIRITRGWVDTRNEPSVSLSGDNFRITFFGNINGTGQNRDFTIRITRSDRGGNANGTATVRLNQDRNEVESITVEGRIGRDQFNGTFNRN
ncbi:MAG: hypothetical protein ABI811_19710 [Acidobacteriota bacterium]